MNHPTTERLAAALTIFHQASRVHGQTVQAHNELVDVLTPIQHMCMDAVRAETDPETGKKLYPNDEARRLEVERRMAADFGDRVWRLADLGRRLQDTRAALDRAPEELVTLRVLVEYDTAVLYDGIAERRGREVLR